MARNRMKLESKFPEVKKAGREAVSHAVRDALAAGQEEAQARIGKARDRTGYDLDPFAVRQKTFRREGGTGADDLEGGMIFVHSDQWYYRFFEYGTVFITATPFMRPAHRKMRKVFAADMASEFEGFIRRRARQR